MKETHLNFLIDKIKTELVRLDKYSWDVYVAPHLEPEINESEYEENQRNDKESYLFFGSRMLYYKICLFLELRNLPYYLELFKNKFSSVIDDTKQVTEMISRYEEMDPTLEILEDFKEFLSSFSEFSTNETRIKNNKLELILKETNNIIIKTKAKISNEADIYNAVRWYIELIYPTSRALKKARFIGKFGTYVPDILIPEISSAVEYKYVRKSTKLNLNTFLDQIKTDADNYVGDHEYRFFYAVFYFQDKSELTQASFKEAIREKKFPENWYIIAV